MTTTTFVPSGLQGPLAGVDYHVALHYYPETGDVPRSRWDVALWDTGPAVWEGIPPVDDVSCDVVAVSLKEGRDLPLSRFRPSSATITLNDPDGIYTPWRTAADPTAYTSIHVGIGITAWVDIGGTEYARFSGTVESITDTFPDQGDQHRVVMTAVDYLGLLGSYDGVEMPEVGAGELAGARLARILANAEYDGPTAFDVGTVALQATTLARNALDESGIVVDTEQGAYWCDRDGVLQFRDRNGLVTEPTYTTVQAVFGDDDPTVEIAYTDVALVSDTDEVRNVVSISNAGGTAVTLDDQRSMALFRPRTFQRMDLIHVDPAESPILAQRHLDFFAYAANRVEEITVDMSTLSDTQRATVLTLDTLQLVELRRRADGFEVVATLQLQGMTETVTADEWTVSFRTFSADAVFDVGRWDVDVWDSGLWGY